MKVDGNKTFWGATIGDDLSRKAKKFLGFDTELQTPGSDARITEQREAAAEICFRPELEGCNARQIMLKHKGAHGSGANLNFSGSDEIDLNMSGHPSDFKVNIYGDGSFTSPTVWWAALGGFGIWVPNWNQDQLQVAPPNPLNVDKDDKADHREPESEAVTRDVDRKRKKLLTMVLLWDKLARPPGKNSLPGYGPLPSPAGAAMRPIVLA